LEPPEGVDAALFVELKDALAALLTTNNKQPTAARFACTPPIGEVNRVTDLVLTEAGGGTYTLAWRYRNSGDYDQNGAVGISDITPIAMHYGENAGADNEWIDGSDDGAIGISDITPLAMNFGVDCAKYVIEISESKDTGYAEVALVPFGAATGDGRKGFFHTMSLPSGIWVRVVPADSGDEKSTDISSNPARVPAEGKALPEAAIEAEPTLGDAPLDVDFDASGSFDPDGGDIARYEWDWEGDGTYEEDTGADPMASHIYNNAGMYDATVRVTDDEGSTATADEAIIVTDPGVNLLPIAGMHVDPIEGEAPLQVYFTSLSEDLDGEIVKYEWDFEGDGTWDITETVGGTEFVYESVGVYHPAHRVTDNRDGTDTVSATVTVSGGGDPPVAELDADPMSGDPPLMVDFNASGSYDPDGGSIVKFEWDWEGDGTYEHDSGTTPTAQHTYNDDGTYPAKVRVTDDEFTTSTATAVITVGAGGTARGDWWMFGREPTHNRHSPFVGAQTKTVKWQFDTGGYVGTSPAIAADGTIYFGSFDDYIYAVNPNGTQKWRYQTGWGINSSPAIAEDGTVYIGGRDGYVYAMNPNGSLKWRYQTDNDIQKSSPAIGTDGTIYIGSLDHYLYALNPDGSLKWRDNVGWADSSPAIGADGTIYICADIYLYAVNPNGSFKWTYEAADSVESSPAIGDDGTIYFGCDDGNLYAVDSGGDYDWSYETGGAIWSSPGIGADGTIYVGSNDDFLYAINPGGTLKWKQELLGRVKSSPTIAADGTIYLSVSYSNWEKVYIYARNPDGSSQWRYDKDSSMSSNSSAAIAPDGTVYIGCGDDLFAFGE
jgi:outer membrane protein assembly factor BamB